MKLRRLLRRNPPPTIHVTIGENPRALHERLRRLREGVDHIRAQRFIRGLGRDLTERSTCKRQPPCGSSPMCQMCIDGFVLFCHETKSKGPIARRRWALFAEWQRESWRREAADV